MVHGGCFEPSSIDKGGRREAFGCAMRLTLGWRVAGEYWELTWEQLHEFFPDMMEVCRVCPAEAHDGPS